MQLSQKTQYLMASLSAKNNYYKRNRDGERQFCKRYVSDLKKKCISQSTEQANIKISVKSTVGPNRTIMMLARVSTDC